MRGNKPHALDWYRLFSGVIAIVFVAPLPHTYKQPSTYHGATFPLTDRPPTQTFCIEAAAHTTPHHHKASSQERKHHHQKHTPTHQPPQRSALSTASSHTQRGRFSSGATSIHVASRTHVHNIAPATIPQCLAPVTPPRRPPKRQQGRNTCLQMHRG